MIKSVSSSHVELNEKDFTKEQLERIDISHLGRTFITIVVNEVNEDYYKIMLELCSLQYKIPMRFLSPVLDVCEYIAQKSPLNGNNKDIAQASSVISPVNGNYFGTVIPYLPINQYMPIGSIVNLYLEVPYVDKNIDKEPVRKFFWSNNLTTNPNIQNEIKKENPNSFNLEPWLKCVHFGSLDIGSRIAGKFIVEETNPDVQHAYSLWNFTRSDETKTFQVSIYDFYNVSPKDLFTRLLNLAKNELTQRYLKGVIDKLK